MWIEVRVCKFEQEKPEGAVSGVLSPSTKKLMCDC
jgi:hypothetical protein